MIYNILKRAIKIRNYESKPDLAEKISIIYANNQLSTDQYEDLIKLLNNDERGE